MRTLSHRLAIETGRRAKPIRMPHFERVYFLCNLIEVHFIFAMQHLTDLRKIFIRKYYWERPNMLQIVQLLKSENKKEIFNLAMFIERQHVL